MHLPVSILQGCGWKKLRTFPFFRYNSFIYLDKSISPKGCFSMQVQGKFCLVPHHLGIVTDSHRLSQIVTDSHRLSQTSSTWLWNDWVCHIFGQDNKMLGETQFQSQKDGPFMLELPLSIVLSSSVLWDCEFSTSAQIGHLSTGQWTFKCMKQQASNQSICIWKLLCTYMTLMRCAPFFIITSAASSALC